MKIIYGKKQNNTHDCIFLDKSDIPIPTGKTFHELPEELLKKIEEEKLNDSSVYKLFAYSNISLWWFIYPTIFTTFARNIFFIKNFEELLDHYQPNSVKVVGEFEKFSLITQICNKHKIPTKISKSALFSWKIKSRLKNILQPYRYKKITNNKFKKRISLFNSTTKIIPDINKKIVLYVPTSYRREIYNPNTRTTSMGEYLIEPIINMIKKMDLDLCGIDIDYSFHGQHQILLDRINSEHDWFPAELIQKKYAIGIIINSFIKNYKQIIENSIFQNLFQFNNIKFWEQMQDDFIMLSYKPYIPTYIELYESFKKFFNIQKPSSIIIPYETGPLALSIIAACKENNIPTIGIEHGGLIAKHPDYIHDIFHTHSNNLGMPLTDKLLVWGDFYKKSLLEQANYPEKNIVVFGNPMYFDIESILTNLDAQELKIKYKIPENKKIILFTTATFQKYYSQGGLKDYDEIILEELSKKFANKDEYFIIIKPHPTELYVDAYKQIIANYNCKNFSLVQGNLFELIHISDTVVSFFSTSLIDSILLNKPTIRVTFPGTEVTSQFIEYGIFLESNISQLSENISSLSNDEILRKTILKNREKFIHDLYNIPNPKAYDQLKSLLNP